MFSYTNNFNKMNNNVKMTDMNNFDVVQKVRQDLIGEIQAIIEYDMHIHSTENMVARETWENIKSEELTHVGELLALLNYLDPSQMKFVQDGISEFNKRLNNGNDYK
ncbi:MAG: ubiquinone biosynthesis protein COQ7 [Christensenellales bacterium]